MSYFIKLLDCDGNVLDLPKQEVKFQIRKTIYNYVNTEKIVLGKVDKFSGIATSIQIIDDTDKEIVKFELSASIYLNANLIPHFEPNSIEIQSEINLLTRTSKPQRTRLEMIDD